jgi:transposase
MKQNTSSKRRRKAPQGREGGVSTASQEKRYELIKLGADTHGGQHTFARMIDNLGCQPPQSLAPQAFIEFLQKQLTLAQRVVMVYEAGPYGFSLYRQATELGVECLVCAPERLSRGRKRVNDKIDAKELLNRLDRHLAGSDTALRLVRPPTLEQEMSRRQARERNTYRKERQRWIGRGRSCLHTLGICRPGRWWEPLRHQELLKQLEARYGQTVRQQVEAELGRYLEMLHLVDGKLAELTAALKTAAAAKKQPRLKGIGPLSSELLDREIGDWTRFKNRRQVASYTGLCPGEDSSGDTQRSLSIDKHGNPRVRAVLVECAWLLPRYQPKYKALQKWKWVFEPNSKAGKALRKKAAVALGRHLAVDLWRLKTGRAKAEELGLSLAV